MKNRDKKKVAAVGWMPFWWGNRFNKRLASKRVRQKERRATMLFKYDITFCNDRECPRTDCRRHPTNVPVGIPVSMFLEKYREGEKCRWYYGDGKNESSRNPTV